MPNRLGSADQAVCENCGGTVIVHLGGLRIPKGGKCRDCGARYNRWNVVELQPRPKFSGGATQKRRSRTPPTLEKRSQGAAAAVISTLRRKYVRALAHLTPTMRCQELQSPWKTAHQAYLPQT